MPDLEKLHQRIRSYSTNVLRDLEEILEGGDHREPYIDSIFYFTLKHKNGTFKGYARKSLKHVFLTRLIKEYIKFRLETYPDQELDCEVEEGFSKWTHLEVTNFENEMKEYEDGYWLEFRIEIDLIHYKNWL